MQYYDNRLTVEADWMFLTGVMSETNYRNLTNRKNIRVVRRGCRGHGALVDYESMPERFKHKITEVLKRNPYDAVKINEIEELIEHSTEAGSYYDNYRLNGGDRRLPAEKRREYYADAIVLDAIGRLITKRGARRRALGHSGVRFWEEISEAVQDLDSRQYPHSLPGNPRSLERKYRRYMKEGYESLIHKTYIAGNKNAGKIVEDAQISAVAVLASDPRNLDNERVARLYNTIAEEMKWKKVTASTIAVWRNKMDNDIYARRYGAGAFRAKKAMQVKRSAPQYPLYYWTLDGWDAELLYRKEEDGRTTYHHRATVVTVLDACCKYPVGYAIGTHETPSLIREALRNAARHTEVLFGRMYRTAQLQSDNYSIKKMMPLYVGMAEKVTPARPGNAKAKIIEPWFRYFNRKYCQPNGNWSGFGVTSRRELQPNGEFLNRYRNSFPDFAGVCRQIAGFMEAERALLRDRYRGLFDEMPEENRFPLSEEEYLMMFGSTTGNRNLLQGSGLNITIGGVRRSYDCFDPGFRQHGGVRWEVRYDPKDLKHVLAVNGDESLRFMLEEKYVQPMALIERKPGDSEELKRVTDYNRRQEEEIAERISGYSSMAARLAALPGNSEAGHDREFETLQKLLICDSRGEHKNRRNEERLSVRSGADTASDSVFDDSEIYDEY